MSKLDFAKMRRDVVKSDIAFIDKRCQLDLLKFAERKGYDAQQFLNFCLVAARRTIERIKNESRPR